MGRFENIVAMQAAGGWPGQGFLGTFDFRIYSQGSASHGNPYVLFGLPGSPPRANLSCHTPEKLWETLMLIGAKPEPEKLSLEELRLALLNDLAHGRVRLEPDGEIVLGDLKRGDIARHLDGKHRIAVARLKSGWKLLEVESGRELSGWAYTTRATRLKVVPGDSKAVVVAA